MLLALEMLGTAKVKGRDFPSIPSTSSWPRSIRAWSQLSPKHRIFLKQKHHIFSMFQLMSRRPTHSTQFTPCNSAWLSILLSAACFLCCASLLASHLHNAQRLSVHQPMTMTEAVGELGELGELLFGVIDTWILPSLPASPNSHIERLNPINYVYVLYIYIYEW